MVTPKHHQPFNKQITTTKKPYHKTYLSIASIMTRPRLTAVLKFSPCQPGHISFAPSEATNIYIHTQKKITKKKKGCKN